MYRELPTPVRSLACCDLQPTPRIKHSNCRAPIRHVQDILILSQLLLSIESTSSLLTALPRLLPDSSSRSTRTTSVHSCFSLLTAPLSPDRCTSAPTAGLSAASCSSKSSSLPPVAPLCRPLASALPVALLCRQLLLSVELPTVESSYLTAPRNRRGLPPSTVAPQLPLSSGRCLYPPIAGLSAAS